MDRLATNARVVRALGARSIRQTFRRPQLLAPIIVFPTVLLAIQTGGAGGAIDLPGFPPVQSFLQFMLAGSMIQSLMLTGNSAASPSRSTSRWASPTASSPRRSRATRSCSGGWRERRRSGLFASLWFLAIGLIFGAEIQRACRRPDRDRPGHLASAIAFGGDRRGDRAAHRQCQRGPGALPAGLRRSLPLLRLLPQRT